jgi:CBS domain-containing protein
VFACQSCGEIVGLLTLSRITQVARSEWVTTTAGEAMLPLEESKRVGPDTGLAAAMQLMDRAGVGEVPVVSDGRVMGLVTREDIVAFLATLRKLGLSASTAPPDR